MAAAVALASDLFQDPSLWEQPAFDHVALMAVVGEGSGRNRDQVRTDVLGLSARSPVLLAFVLAGDCDHVYFGHSLSLVPGDPLSTTIFDEHVCVLIGNDLQAATSVVLPDNAFGRSVPVHCKEEAVIVGAAGHGAVPPVMRSGPHASTAASVNELRIRRAFVMRGNDAVDALTRAPNGRMSLITFYTEYVHDGMADADGAVVAATTPACECWRACSTDLAGGAAADSFSAVAPIASALPHVSLVLNQWSSRIKARQLARIGHGGPQLSNAAFTAGVGQLETVITETATQRLQFERDRINKTFSQKHGDHLGAMVRAITGSVDDNALPEAHRLLARSPKGRDYGILNQMFSERASSSEVPLTQASAPLATTKIVEDVFRNFRVATTGLSFAEGLTPFAIVCEGHSEMASVRHLVRQAEIAEGGTGVSLDDAARLTASDIRFPTEPQVAAEKLYGWSVLIDIFHGVNHPIAMSVRGFVIAVGPALHRIRDQMGATHALGMDLVNRVLFESQQEYFDYINRLARATAATMPACPDFRDIRNKVETYRVSSLSPLPSSWYTMVDAPAPASDRRPTREQARSPAGRAGAVPTFNTWADRTLMARFRGSGFSNIKSMMEGKDVAIPKIGGKNICLVWALKGGCGSDCKRHLLHTKYERETIQELHKFLTDCGVSPQRD